MYECEIGQGLLGNSVARAMGGAVQDATLPCSSQASRLRRSPPKKRCRTSRRDLLVLSAAIASELKSKLTIRQDGDGVSSVIGEVKRLAKVLQSRAGDLEHGAGASIGISLCAPSSRQTQGVGITGSG